jgi:hypothetical protein
VVSGRPTSVGDAAGNEWVGRFLRDDYGRYRHSDRGERLQNPDFDPGEEYIPRQDRQEWAAVGLVGKLFVRPGAPTHPLWKQIATRGAARRFLIGLPIGRPNGGGPDPLGEDFSDGTRFTDGTGWTEQP